MDDDMYMILGCMIITFIAGVITLIISKDREMINIGMGLILLSITPASALVVFFGLLFIITNYMNRMFDGAVNSVAKIKNIKDEK